ncbi:Peptidoglycan glycosyltransferase, partial [mine drainage metagenome]
TKNPNAYFLEYLRRRLEMTMSSTQLYGGGLRIFTSLDSRIQNLALHSLRKGLRTIDRRKGFRGAIRHLSPHDLREVERETVPLSLSEKGSFTLGDREEVVITYVEDR